MYIKFLNGGRNNYEFLKELILKCVAWSIAKSWGDKKHH